MPKQKTDLKHKLMVPFFAFMGLFPYNVSSAPIEPITIPKLQTEEISKNTTQIMSEISKNLSSRTSIRELKHNLHEERLEPYQKLVLETAQQLEGKVKYFWGGKPRKIGIDETWGQPKKVKSKFNKTYGTIQPYGLDCSGFIAWVIETASNGRINDNDIGINTTTLLAKSTPLEESEAKIGDLVFNKKGNHAGIVSKISPDGIMVIHLSQTLGTVAETSPIFTNNPEDNLTEFRRLDPQIINKLVDTAKIYSNPFNYTLE